MKPLAPPSNEKEGRVKHPITVEPRDGQKRSGTRRQYFWKSEPKELGLLSEKRNLKGLGDHVRVTSAYCKDFCN